MRADIGRAGMVCTSSAGARTVRASIERPRAGRSHAGRRADIQGLRALAVLAVIADHLFGAPRGGFVGVDVFFVISGYLITGLLLREHGRTGAISFRGFYRRRIKRIIPGAVLVLVVTTAAAHVLISAARATAVTKDAVWSLFFAGNWRFALAGTDYFQEGLPPSPLQHFWSLGVEEQFYLVWPWLMSGLLAVAMGRLAWSRLRARAAVLAASTAATLCSFAWALWETHARPTVAYFSTFSRGWELGLGAMIAVVGPILAAPRLTRSARVRLARRRVAWAGLAGILVSLVVVPPSPGFPAPWALLPVLSTGAVIAAGHGVRLSIRPLVSPASQYVGDLSYSLYLWHFPVIVLLVPLVGSGTASYYLLCVLATGGLAALGYHHVEDPIRRSDWLTRPRHGSHREQLVARRRRWLVGTGLAGATVVLVTLVLSPTTGSSATLSADSPRPVIAAPCVGAAARAPDQHCAQTPPTDEVQPSPDQVLSDYRGAYDCWTDKNQPLRSCSYGSTRPDALRLALVGDSHAAMLLPGLRGQLERRNWRLDTFVGWGCPWMRLAEDAPCSKALGEAERRMETGPKYDVVLTSAARLRNGHDKARVSADMAAVWAPVAARGSKIVVIGDNPTVSSSALDCVMRVGFDPRDDVCSTPRQQAVAEIDPLIAAARAVPPAKVVDLTSFFCDDTRCPAVIGGVIVYRDTIAHITGTYSETLGPYLAQGIAQAIA